MANMKLKPGVIQILDDHDAYEDPEFLSHIEAAETLALSSAKRRRISLPSSPPPPPSNEVEGAYTAALKGSKSLTWQKQQTHVPPSSPPTRGTATGGGGGGGACFKCGKEGHWARDCNQGASPGMAGGVEKEKGCPCGAGNCLVLTANTERNRGRQFFKCPIRQENGGCGFFEWCDELSSNQTSAEAWKNGGQQQLHQRAPNQGASGLTKSWNEYDNGTGSLNSGYGAAQKFETADKKGYGARTGSSCFKCGNEGHWARDCHSPSSNTSTGVKGRTSSDTCYKCGGSGHWAKDCTQGQSTKLRNW